MKNGVSAGSLKVKRQSENPGRSPFGLREFAVHRPRNQTLRRPVEDFLNVRRVAATTRVAGRKNTFDIFVHH